MTFVKEPLVIEQHPSTFVQGSTSVLGASFLILRSGPSKTLNFASDLGASSLTLRPAASKLCSPE